MTKGFKMIKKLSILFSFTFLVFLLVVSVSSGCKLTEKNLTGKTSDNLNAEKSEESEGKALSGSDMDFLSSVPVHPDADMLESGKDGSGDSVSYLIKMQYKGSISELSDWYEEQLKKGWNIGPISKGDMGDWSEFFVEANNEGLFLTIYLYQDEANDFVSVDLNITGSGKGQEAAQNTVQYNTQATGSSSTEITGVQENNQANQVYSGELENAKIALVCASVGAAWNVSEHFPELDISVYDEYQFDKSNRIQDILNSEKPDIMIIKECAAYFPPDSQGTSMVAYQGLIEGWVSLCRNNGVIPVLTTVVPIDPENPSNSGSSQLDSILDYNDWVKQYCSSENISVLDLESALHISDGDRSLNPVYDSGDGLHPNDLAYTEKLDNILIPALNMALEAGY
jgi:hypothetical protein